MVPTLAVLRKSKKDRTAVSIYQNYPRPGRFKECGPAFCPGFRILACGCRDRQLTGSGNAKRELKGVEIPWKSMSMGWSLSFGACFDAELCDIC